MYFTKYFFLFVLSSNILLALPLKLDDLILEGHLQKRWLICKEKSLISLQPDEDFVSGNCYKWYKKDLIGNYSFINKKDYQIYEHPQETSWYRVDVVTCNNSTVIRSHYIKVYVIGKIEIWENSAISECMDEYSEVKIVGKIFCIDLSEVNSMSDQGIKIEASYSPDQGYLNYSEPVPIVNGKFKMMMPFKVNMIKSSTKNYNLNFTVDFDDCSTNQVTINVKRLWIDKFRNSNSIDESEWNVVVNNPQSINEFKVNCTAQATSQIIKFTWLPWSDYWQFTQNISNLKDLNGLNFEPFNGKMPDSHLAFGYREGTILLIGEDINNRMYKVSSANIENAQRKSRNADPLKPWRFMEPKKYAHVFFHKDDLINVTGNGSINMVPLWFKYWTQFIRDPKNYITQYIYIPKLGDSHAAYQRPTRDNYNNGMMFMAPLVVAQSASEKLKLRTEDGKEIPGNDFDDAIGIYSYYCIMAHESSHAKFATEHWITGYSANLDSDNGSIGDFYRDSWEDDFKNKYGGKEFRKYPFSSKYDDYIKPELVDKQFINPDRMDLDINGVPRFSVGQDYEEGKAYLLEYDAYKNIHNVLSLDWSYDRYGIYQGKQWK